MKNKKILPDGSIEGETFSGDNYKGEYPSPKTNETFEQYSSSYPDSALVLCGKISEKERKEILSQKTRGEIIILGEVTNSDLSLLFNGAIAFTSASKDET